MAISFKEKIAYVNKYAPKSNDKVQKLIKLAVNIDSAKLNLTDEQKTKLKDGVEKAFQQFKEKNAAVKTSTPSQPAKKRGRPKGSGKKSTSSASSTKAILQNFKAKVGKKVYKRATTRTNVRVDMERPAVKPGKRIVRKKGETSNQYGTFSNKPGRKYWENRANRMDVNQPSKTRYPKLAKGGMVKGKWRAAYPYVDTMQEFKDENDFSTWESSDQKRFEELVNQNMVRVSGGVFQIKEVNSEQARELYNELRQMGVNLMDDFDDWKASYSKYAKGGQVEMGVKIKDIPNLEVQESEMFDSAQVAFQPKNSNVGRALGIVTKLGKGKYEAIQLIKPGVTQKVGSYRTRKEALEALLNSNIFEGSNDEIVAKLEKEVSGEFAEGGNVERGAASLLIKMDNGDYTTYRGDESTLKKGAKPLFTRKNAPQGTWKKIIQELSGKKMEDGGSIAQGNYEMVLSKAKELHHHASELQDALKKEKNIEAWVVAKVERASQDLSDVTHYLDGMSEYAQGGTLAGNLDVDGIGFGLMAKGGELKGKQKNLDMNHNGKLDKEDFQIIRSGKRIVRKSKK
jgi:hypothetical protein